MPTWTIEPEPVTAEWVDEVMRQYFTEMGRQVLGRDGTPAELTAVLTKDPHEDLSPPRGRFLVARDADGEFLGCAGVRLLPDLAGTAELKRMFVHPAGRGTGLGRGLLAAVESTARDLGATRVVCETNKELVAARTLYARNGYEEIEPYPGHGRADHWFAKELGLQRLHGLGRGRSTARGTATSRLGLRAVHGSEHRPATARVTATARLGLRGLDSLGYSDTTAQPTAVHSSGHSDTTASALAAPQLCSPHSEAEAAPREARAPAKLGVGRRPMRPRPVLDGGASTVDQRARVSVQPSGRPPSEARRRLGQASQRRKIPEMERARQPPQTAGHSPRFGSPARHGLGHSVTS